MPEAAGAARRFLTFRLDRRLYALPADQVTEVIRTPAVARVPQGPPGLLGLANLRGDVLPVASLRGLLGEAAATSPDGRAIVLGGETAVALAVDSVGSLVSVDAGALETRRAELVAEGGERLQGAFETGRDVAKVLDLAAMLAIAFVHRPKSTRAVRTAKAALAEGRETAAEAGQGLVTFEIAGQEFALPLEAVREVIPAAGEIILAAGADDVVLGVSAYRGGLLPLMSLRGLLGFGAGEATGREGVIVTSVGGVAVGFVADRMRAVLTAPAADIDPTPAVLAARIGGEAKVSGIYRGDGGRRLISIIEPDQLFREEIMQRLSGGTSDVRGGEATGAAAQSAQLLFLVFRLEGDEFALPISAVDEVAIAPEQVTRVPKMPAFLEGVTNLRGEVLPVVDQRRRFGMPEATDLAKRRLVVVRTAHHRAGLIVDAVSEVLRAGEDALQDAPELAGEANPLVTGVINLGDAGRIIMVLDPAELLSRVEHGLLDAFEGASDAADQAGS